MIENEFIPLSVSSFNEYLLKKFNINIDNIPDEDWDKLIYKNYCKNNINNKYCFKKIKKVESNINICSKCCEKMKLKTYKRNKKKCKKKEKNNENKNIDEDSGFYTETDNDIENKSKLNYEGIHKIKDTKEHENSNYIYFGSIGIKSEKNYNKIQLKDEKNELINNNYINNSNYIKFGDLHFKLNKSEFSIEEVNDNISGNGSKEDIIFDDKISISNFSDTNSIYTEISDNICFMAPYVDQRYITLYIEYIIDELDKLKTIINDEDKIKWINNIYNSLDYLSCSPDECCMFKNVNNDEYIRLEHVYGADELLVKFTEIY